MQVLEKVRLSDEQIDTLDTGGTVAFPASWEEFVDFLAEANYSVEYHNGQIIVMGLASLIHELLVGDLISLLKEFYRGKLYYVASSNAGIRKDNQKGHYNGDVLVIKGKPVYQGEFRSIITNPYLVVEILSASTLNYDLGAKRWKYEQMETLQELVFVNPFDKEVLVCRRTEQANVWTETAYRQSDQIVNIDGLHVSLQEIFGNLPEEE